MRWPSDIPDAEIDRLLAGHAAHDSGLNGVAEFLGEVDAAIPQEPTARLETAHIAAMVEAAQVLATNGGFAEQPVDPAIVMHARRGHVFAFKNLAAHKWASAAVLSVMGLLAFGGAAYAGVLPAPVQEATSQIAQEVGISIPKAHRVKQAANNGVRDLGAGVGRGKGQGGIHRNQGDAGQGQTSATSTVDVEKAKKAAAVLGAQKANAKRQAAKAKAAANAKARTKAAKARSKANASAKKKAKAKAKTKVKKKTSSSSGTKKPSSVESDR